MEDKLLSVHELGKLFNLTNQTMHFYDRKDLLKPTTVTAKGYRKYSYNQIYSLSKICYLRKIGYSIDEIHRYINSPDINSNIQSLEKHSTELIEQYEIMLEMNKTVQRKLHFVKNEMKKIDLDITKIIHFAARSYLPIGDESLASRDEIFYLYPTMALYHQAESPQSMKLSLGAYIEFPEKLSEETRSETIDIREGDFLSFYHKGHYLKVRDKIEKIRRENTHLPLERYAVSLNIVDQFIENNEENFVVFIQIPLKNH